ncbi:hypothetical protein [Kitasatospora sp. NPDC057198]|uniref:hypothetical protein n=1 Tax=Kitasatospora sp. NPDC057198 TaxID=3346046 RepID=UPI00363D26C2
MRRTVAAKGLGAGLGAAVLVAVTAVPASADPAPGVLPAAQDIVGVGADTTAALMNRLSADYNATVSGTAPHLYSWDAAGSLKITPKSGAAEAYRPRGTYAGLLAQLYDPAAVDFVPAARGPRSGEPLGLLYVAYGKDAVTWSAKAGGHAPADLTTQNLFDIYSCFAGKTDWAAFGGTAGTIKPYLPQLGSSTRERFLKAIGSPVLGACVVTGPEENQGTDPVLNDPDVIFPYSVGHWVGQADGHTTATDDRGVLTPRSVNGVAPLTASGTLNPLFANTVHGELIYNVVEGSAWSDPVRGPQLRAFFGPLGYLCSSAGRAAVVDYGYMTVPPALCGSTSHI